MRVGDIFASSSVWSKCKVQEEWKGADKAEIKKRGAGF